MHRIARAEADAKTCLVLAPLHAQPLLLHPVPARARASHCQTSRSEYDAIAGTLPRQPQNHTPPALERPQPPHALEGRHSSRCPPRMSSNGVKGAAVSAGLLSSDVAPPIIQAAIASAITSSGDFPARTGCGGALSKSSSECLRLGCGPESHPRSTKGECTIVQLAVSLSRAAARSRPN
eukprot:1789254-Rhodomonas_salina.2